MKTIIGRGGKIKCYITEMGGRKEILAPGGSLLGYYSVEQDKTYQRGGVFYSNGDCLMELLSDESD
jgi:hypothetical protein